MEEERKVEREREGVEKETIVNKSVHVSQDMPV